MLMPGLIHLNSIKLYETTRLSFSAPLLTPYAHSLTPRHRKNEYSVLRICNTFETLHIYNR